jgi:hypothetical protein
MSLWPVCRSTLVLLLIGCAASRVPATGFAEPKAVEHAVTRYYERNASEEYRTCLTPYMDGLTRVAVVDQQPDRLVLDVGYFYRDRFKDDGGSGIGRECTGFAARQFTLVKSAGGVEVAAMSESRR